MLYLLLCSPLISSSWCYIWCCAHICICSLVLSTCPHLCITLQHNLVDVISAPLALVLIFVSICKTIPLLFHNKAAQYMLIFLLDCIFFILALPAPVDKLFSRPKKHLWHQDPKYKLIISLQNPMCIPSYLLCSRWCYICSTCSFAHLCINLHNNPPALP